MSVEKDKHEKRKLSGAITDIRPKILDSVTEILTDWCVFIVPKIH
jgi:hypothetical protein